MEVLCIGVVRMNGIGKESGNPFDFGTLRYLLPVEPVSKEKFQLQGFGYEVAELELATQALPKFAQVRFPCRLNLETDLVPQRRGIKTVVVGFKPAEAVPARAA
jgi:hypothetical protein